MARKAWLAWAPSGIHYSHHWAHPGSGHFLFSAQQAAEGHRHHVANLLKQVLHLMATCTDRGFVLFGIQAAFSALTITSKSACPNQAQMSLPENL